MKVDELIDRLIKLYPRQAAAIDAWTPEFKSVLQGFEGEGLASAYRQVMAKWEESAFPRPVTFRARCSRPAKDDGPTAKERWAYVDAHTPDMVNRIVESAMIRWRERHGGKWGDQAELWLREEAKRLANDYLQRRFLIERGKRPEESLAERSSELSDETLDHCHASLRTWNDLSVGHSGGGLGRVNIPRQSPNG